MQRNLWRIQAGTVFKGIVLLTLTGLAGSIFDAIGDFSNKVDWMKIILNNDISVFFQPDCWDIASWMMMLLEVFGYVLYFSGLKQFATLLQAKDADYILEVRMGAILTMIGVIVGQIPILGWVVKLVLVIVGFLKMLSGYKGLKNSSTFPATEGAATLHSALIVQLIGVMAGLLPAFGSVLESFMDIFVFFMVIGGWRTIKNSVSPIINSLPKIQHLSFDKVPGGLMIAWGVGGFLGLNLLWCLGNVFTSVLSYNLLFTESLGNYYLILGIIHSISIIGMILYTIGIRKVSLSLKDNGVRGLKTIFVGMLFYAVLLIFDVLLWSLRLESILHWEHLNICFTLFCLIALIIIAIGFRNIGKTGSYGYMGKRGGISLLAAAWMSVGIQVTYMLFPIIVHALFLTDTNRDINSLVDWVNLLFNLVRLIVSAIVFFLTWNGWLHLLSEWFGERIQNCMK